MVRRRAPPVSGPHTAVGVDRLADPDEEMERLMSGAADRSLSGPMEAAVLRVSETTGRRPSAGGERSKVRPPASGSGVEVVERAESGAKTASESRSSTEAKSSSERVSRPSLTVVDGGSSPARPNHETHAARPARASRPIESDATGEPSASKGSPWLWVGVGVVVLGVVGAVAVRGGSSNDPDVGTPVAAVTAGARSDSSPEPVVPGLPGLPDRSEDGSTVVGEAQRAQPLPSDDPGGLPTSATAVGSGADSGVGPGTLPDAPSGIGSGDPREPPPGTPPEIAAVFRRLPVSPSDGPPIGGIGANGIHIDEMHVGSKVTGGTCSGLTKRFSVSVDRVGICVRVVHPRERDELQVLWQKHGGTTRRSKMVVLPKHAYRTRGYLKLRREYIGDWTVRILSSDGVELARHDFTIVP